MRRARGPVFVFVSVACALVGALSAAALADEPPSKAVVSPAPSVAAPSAQPVAPTPAPTLQVAGSPPAVTPPPRSEPSYESRLHDSDGAGPRLTFGRTFTEYLKPGFYGRFETEYFEVNDVLVKGALLGLEGWGTEGATAGGGSIPVSVFAGARGGPFSGPKAPVFFITAGVGVDLVIYDRVGQEDGFGLLSPFAVGTAGIEVQPGVRLLADGRASYRWHWTSQSQAQFQIGLTLGLNSYLWDGP